MRETLLYEGHLRPPGVQHDLAFVDLEITGTFEDRPTRHGHCLEDHQPASFPENSIQSEQRVAQMVKHAEEEHEIEHVLCADQIIDLQLLE
jgi:hypothetical protein